MGVTSRISGDRKQLKILVEGRFDFASHDAFRDAYTKVEPLPREITIDLHKAEYMDSAALGMLLMLRERAGGDQARIHIEGAGPTVRDILRVARFDQLFQIR